MIIQEAFRTDGAQSVLELPSLDVLTCDPRYPQGLWMLAQLGLNQIDTTSVRLNISQPSNVVQQVDAYARLHSATRGGFLAQAARWAMTRT